MTKYNIADDEDLFAPATTHAAPAAPVATPPAPVIADLGFEGLSAAEQYAILTSIRDAFAGAAEAQKVKLLDEYADAQFPDDIRTPFGPVAYQPKGPRSLSFNMAAMIEHVRAVAPDLIEQRVVEVLPDDVIAKLQADTILIEDSGEDIFILQSTGEAVSFASAGTAPAAKVTWSASRQQKAAKSLARQVVRERMDSITTPLLEVLNVSS
ncbi:MAG: hypothetical protein CMH36_08905 [Microbacterium sp.]|uniref:hypothetical protein n=1 Tax=Microbacterium sp. 4NA327F11 TaxID=2502229 RepID=UPI000C90C2F3|nr:hypothetical protein [Microbacterium sp. 4NA327F11]MAL06930.1 hypothetical protein [Microbacterium sp.]